MDEGHHWMPGCRTSSSLDPKPKAFDTTIGLQNMDYLRPRLLHALFTINQNKYPFHTKMSLPHFHNTNILLGTARKHEL